MNHDEHIETGGENPAYQRTPDTMPEPGITELDNGRIIKNPPENLRAQQKFAPQAGGKTQLAHSTDVPIDPRAMAPEDASEANPYEQPVERGTLVFSLDGKEIGQASGQPSRSNYLAIEHNTISTADLYIPRTAIINRDEQGIHLNVTKDEIERMDWSTPPPAHD